MIAEAIDAAYTLGWALFAWIVVGAVALTAVVYAVGGLLWLAGRWAWKTARRAHAAASRTNTPPHDSRVAEDAPKSADARTGLSRPINLKDAA